MLFYLSIDCQRFSVKNNQLAWWSNKQILIYDEHIERNLQIFNWTNYRKWRRRNLNSKSCRNEHTHDTRLYKCECVLEYNKKIDCSGSRHKLCRRCYRGFVVQQDLILFSNFKVAINQWLNKIKSGQAKEKVISWFQFLAKARSD